MLLPNLAGAMGLTIGARQSWLLMEHVTKSGQPKLVPRCTYPVAGLGCVRRVYTDLAVLEITAAGIVARARAEGVDFAALLACTGVHLLA